MAVNTYAPFGFREWRLWSSGVPNYAVNARPIAYNYSSQIAMGDPVFLNTSGQAALYVNGGSTIDGIAVGFNWFDPNNSLSGNFHQAWTAPTLASGTNVTCKVITDPAMVFIVQGNQNGATVPTESSIGKNCDLYTGSSGSPTSGSGQSVAAIDVNSIANTATLPFRIVGIVGITPGFDGYGLASYQSYVATNANQLFAVTLNTQDMPAGTRTGQA